MAIPAAERIRRVAGGFHGVTRALRNAAHDAAHPIFDPDGEDPLAAVLDREIPVHRNSAQRSLPTDKRPEPRDGALVGL